MRLGNTPLMVTEDGDQAIGLVVSVKLFLKSGAFKIALVKQPLKGDRGIVCTEHLGRKSFHLLCEMFVQGRCLESYIERRPKSRVKNAYRHTIKYTIISVLVFFEDSDVLENLSVDSNSVIVSDGIFPKEVEDNEVRLF
jgi:hypothetical protein